MMSQKTVAAALLVGSSILTAWVLNDVAYPAILCILGLLGLSRRLLWTIPPSRRIITSLLMLVLAALFAVHYRLAVISRAGAFLPTAIDAWQTVARFFLASMVLVLYLGERDTLPASFAFFQIALIVSAGQILLLDDRIALFRLLEFASVAGAALYVITYRSADLPPQTRTCPWRSSGTLALVLALVLTLNGGWVLGSVLYRYQGTINALGAWFWGETSGPLSMAAQTGEVGFSASGRLSSLMVMLERSDQTPALRINCDRSPGYLRARAFETYRQSEWHDRSYQEVLNPNPSGALGLSLPGGRQRFLLSKSDTDGLPSMTIQRSDFGDTLFTRLGTIAVDIPAGTLLRGDDDILRIRNPRESFTYKVLFSTGPDRTEPGTTQQRRMLALPSNLDPRVGDLARQIFSSCQTTTDKIEAVVGHFRRRYTYALGLSVPQDQDALTYFLIEASTGYCEYFASGAALLLRMADVPTRYVTGFLATEKDILEDVWIVRNSHAHAWVEAWNQDQGCWTVVEATVSQDAGAGQDLASGNAGDRDGWQLYQQFLRAVYAYGLFGPLAWAVTYHPVWAAVGSLLGTAGLAVLWVFIRRARSKSPEDRGQIHRSDPIYMAMARLLARVDRRVRRWGLVRGPAETLQAFSLRVEQHTLPNHRGLGEAQWYRRYSDLRYRPAVTAHDVHDLRQATRHPSKGRALN